MICYISRGVPHASSSTEASHTPSEATLGLWPLWMTVRYGPRSTEGKRLDSHWPSRDKATSMRRKSMLWSSVANCRAAGFRWAAAGLALCACVVEFVCKLRESWWSSWRGTARRAGVRLTGPMRSVITRLRLRLLPSSCGGSYINLLMPRRLRAETTGPSGIRAGQDDAARRSERPLPYNFMAPIMPVIGAVAVGRLPRQPAPPSPWSSRRGWREWSACRGARGPGHARG